MRILVLGAGGIGGYYGARMHAAGGNVTFLVRPGRAAQLREKGLQVFSPFGDLQISPQLVTKETLTETFDVILLTCKAFDLDSAMDAIAPAIGEQSAIVPLLNGVRHIDRLVTRFGAARVLGGVALISVTLAANGEIHHLNKLHRFTVGSLGWRPSPWLEPLSRLMESSGVDFVLADNIGQAMWDKMVFLATLAGATCLMRSSVGTIMSTLAGESFINGLLDECAAVADANGRKLGDTQLTVFRNMLTDRSSALVASMLRDVEANKQTEGDHILGDMISWAANKKLEVPLLKLAYSHLQAYERRRQG
ncbi:MAG: ketopantoate reductase family protein [Propionivibrio sp.]|nr:ketopantoate reductase family protein [Propionivibrio sp.]